MQGQLNSRCSKDAYQEILIGAGLLVSEVITAIAMTYSIISNLSIQSAFTRHVEPLCRDNEDIYLPVVFSIGLLTPLNDTTRIGFTCILSRCKSRVMGHRVAKLRNGPAYQSIPDCVGDCATTHLRLRIN